MHKYLLYAFATACFISCGSTTRIIHSWRDPEVVINTSTSNKFIVAALLKNERVRKRTEDLMSFYYPGKAVSSYKKLGIPALTRSQETYDQQLRKEGFDAVVVIRLVKAGRADYEPGKYPSYYYSWRDFYNHSWPGYYDPGDYAIKKKYMIEVNVYSLEHGKLAWNGITSTLNPSGTDEMFDEVIRIMSERMRKEGFLSAR